MEPKTLMTEAQMIAAGMIGPPDLWFTFKLMLLLVVIFSVLALLGRVAQSLWQRRQRDG